MLYCFFLYGIHNHRNCIKFSPGIEARTFHGNAPFIITTYFRCIGVTIILYSCNAVKQMRAVARTQTHIQMVFKQSSSLPWQLYEVGYYTTSFYFINSMNIEQAISWRCLYCWEGTQLCRNSSETFNHFQTTVHIDLFRRLKTFGVGLRTMSLWSNWKPIRNLTGLNMYFGS